LARRLDSFPAVATRRYPWDEWLNGEVWQLERGVDYSAKTTTVMANARGKAKNLGGMVRLRTLNENGRESVVIQFTKAR
jgi:hypothetical protein